MSVSGLRAVRVAALSLSLAVPASAQVIQVKTIPIAQGNQFQIFPSANLGMGSVSIATSDSLQDPFMNPATGSRVPASRIFSTPTVYSVTHGTGGGRSLPFALLARRADWYGGLAFALQQVEPSRPPQFNGGIAVPVDALPPPGGIFAPQTVSVDQQAHGNQFVFGMVGRSIPGSNLSIGASVLWNGLHAVDGVDLLYAGSRRIKQTGHDLDLRVGAVKEWPGERGARSLEAIVVHNRFATTHDVTYADVFWDPIGQVFREQARLERNFDHTNTWGLQLGYQIPLPTPGWRVGWLAIANRASHPKIPNYALDNVPAIPRDPGSTSAFNLGVGVSKTTGAARFGADVIYEPISSYTWADAATGVVTAGGDTIGVGGKTLENRFRFSNMVLRIGFDQPWQPKSPAAFQLGLIVHSINYHLTQRDNVQLLEGRLTSSWVEWTPTWGFSLRRPEFELRYQGRSTKGGGRPQSPIFIGFNELRVAGSSILAAPTGQVFMQDVSTVTHQISISLPLR